MLWLLTRSSAWNRENGDLKRKWGPFGDPKTEKAPHGDPLGSSVNVINDNCLYVQAQMGVHECVTHKLIDPFQVLYDKVPNTRNLNLTFFIFEMVLFFSFRKGPTSLSTSSQYCWCPTDPIKSQVHKILPLGSNVKKKNNILYSEEIVLNFPQDNINIWRIYAGKTWILYSEEKAQILHF